MILQNLYAILLMRCLYILSLIVVVSCGDEKSASSFWEASDQIADQRIINSILIPSDSLKLSSYGIYQPVGLALYDNHIYIADRSTQEIVVLDKHSYNLVESIQIAKGSGPGEINSLIFDANYNHFVIMDPTQSKVQLHDVNGNILNEFTGHVFNSNRLKIYDTNEFIVLSDPLLSDQGGVINRFDFQGGMVSSFGIIERDVLSSLRSNGYIEIDEYGDIYYAGFAEHIIKKWDSEGELVYSVKTIDYHPSEVNYLVMGDGEDKIYRYSEFAYMSAIETAINEDFLFVLHGGISGDRSSPQVVDLYNLDNGYYEYSLEFPYRSGIAGLVVNEDLLYRMQIHNNDYYLFIYKINNA